MRLPRLAGRSTRASWTLPSRAMFFCRALPRTRSTSRCSRSDEVASERLHRLVDLVRGRARQKNIARLGSVHEALVERPAKRGNLMLARTRSNHLVLLDLPGTAVGSYHQVRLTGTTGSTFTGSVVAPALAVL